MLRLELGISADLIDLARAINTPLTRPQWMRLRAAGHLTVEAVEQLNVRDLGRILGDERGAEIMQRGIARQQCTRPPSASCNPHADRIATGCWTKQGRRGDVTTGVRAGSPLRRMPLVVTSVGSFSLHSSS